VCSTNHEKLSVRTTQNADSYAVKRVMHIIHRKSHTLCKERIPVSHFQQQKCLAGMWRVRGRSLQPRVVTEKLHRKPLLVFPLYSQESKQYEIIHLRWPHSTMYQFFQSCILHHVPNYSAIQGAHHRGEKDTGRDFIDDHGSFAGSCQVGR